ncbi:hypothetical protein QQ25_23145 [Mycolicibacterium setense]|nr:hypothetical protein QQ25_23145 [Mycolicibacterium setense]
MTFVTDVSDRDSVDPAGFVACLAGPDAEYLTGQAGLIDGNWCIGDTRLASRCDVEHNRR